ncbi:MAG: response regulator transcription factor [Bacteroidia bacterium]|nr:response regulator transcription factor [Bacteroidia bacterium]
MVKVILADDHQVFMDGITLILAQKGIEVIGQASNGERLMELLKIKQPDIVFLDLSMPKMNGFEAFREIKKTYPDLRVIALSMNADYRSIKPLIQEKIDGYVLKDLGQKEIFKAIEKVRMGNIYYSEEVWQIYGKGKQKESENINSQEFGFTKRELEIINLIALGLTTVEISKKLHRAPETIARHRKNMIHKAKTMLGLNNMTALVAYAKDKGFID